MPCEMTAVPVGAYLEFGRPWIGIEQSQAPCGRSGARVNGRGEQLAERANVLRPQTVPIVHVKVAGGSLTRLNGGRLETLGRRDDMVEQTGDDGIAEDVVEHEDTGVRRRRE